MSEPLNKDEAIRRVVTQAEMLSRGLLREGIDLCPLEIQIDGGGPVVLLVIRQSAWAEFQDALREHGGRPVPQLLT